MAPSKELLSNIQEDVSDSPAVGKSDEEANDADKDAELALKQQLVLIKREQLNQAVQNREERKKYARHIFLFTCIWASVIFLVIILGGWKKLTSFDLSDKVLITLITSTTVNFFGFFLLVVKYLFHTGETDKEKEKDKNKAKVKPKVKSKAESNDDKD